MRKQLELLDKKFGMWTVIEQVENINGRTYWLCECICGFRKTVSGTSLINKRSTKCLICAKHATKGPNNIFHWSMIQASARKRNIEFFINREECYDLLIKQNFKCSISGIDIYLSKNSKEYLELKTTASLDRIDSNKGYIVGNVQWIHKVINTMKWDFDQEYFINMCKMITEYQQLKLK